MVKTCLNFYENLHGKSLKVKYLKALCEIGYFGRFAIQFLFFFRIESNLFVVFLFFFI